MVDTRGIPWIVDVNTSPGMTDTSLLPMAALSAGLAFPDLCERVVQLALSRAAPADDLTD
jgi:D-alanine-D-alanine ligase